MDIIHKGKTFQLPFRVQEAASSYIFSLIDYDSALSFCEHENYVPVTIKTSDDESKAICLVVAIDYKRTSACPFHEWFLGIPATTKGKYTYELRYINETSLFFHAILDNKQAGNTILCIKLILDETLPKEIGYDYYGFPKELGKIEYNYKQKMCDFSVASKDGINILKVLVPSKRGIRFRLLVSLIKAFGIRAVIRSLRKKETIITLAGSTKILAKNGNMNIKVDTKFQLFPWDAHDCKMEINPESDWGKVLLELKLQPKLVFHMSNFQFELSEPFDQ